MRLGVGAVEQNLGRRPTAGGKRMEDVQPNTLGCPTDEPIVKFAVNNTQGPDQTSFFWFMK
jgi:hypothetical protein